jgi:hypothetical protein
MIKTETAEMCLLREVTGYRMTGHKHNDNIREEVQKKWEDILERMSEDRILKGLWRYAVL